MDTGNQRSTSPSPPPRFVSSILNVGPLPRTWFFSKNMKNYENIRFSKQLKPCKSGHHIPRCWVPRQPCRTNPSLSTYNNKQVRSSFLSKSIPRRILCYSDPLVECEASRRAHRSRRTQFHAAIPSGLSMPSSFSLPHRIHPPPFNVKQVSTSFLFNSTLIVLGVVWCGVTFARLVCVHHARDANGAGLAYDRCVCVVAGLSLDELFI